MSAPCPHYTWLLILDTFDRKTDRFRVYKRKEYFFRDAGAPLSWHDAADFCKKLWNGRGSLPKIENEDENQWFYHEAGHETVWLGASDLAMEGFWRWQDATSLGKTYQKWLRGEPNNKNKIEHCAAIAQPWSKKAEWIDANCTLLKQVACQVRDMKFFT